MLNRQFLKWWHIGKAEVDSFDARKLRGALPLYYLFMLRPASQQCPCFIHHDRAATITSVDSFEALSPIDLGLGASCGAELDVRVFEMEVDCLNISE